MKTQSLHIRVDEKEKSIILEYVKTHSLNLSEWVRKLILREIERGNDK